MKFVVLGGYGIIGKVAVADLFKFSKSSEIVIAGRDLEKAEKYAQSFRSDRVKAQKIDVNDIDFLARTLKGADVAVNCVQYYFNLNVMKAALKAKTHYVDLGGMFHMTRKQLELQEDFKKVGKTAILGIGGTPGITNVLAYYGSSLLKSIKDIDITFIDKDETTYNQSFVLPYSFKTLVDEYSMKPAVFKNGKIKFVEPHSGIKKYESHWGKREGFYTLHSEIATLPESLKHKGIRNCEFRVTFEPEFSEVMESLIDLGFVSNEKMKFKDREVSIIDVSADLMDKLIVKDGTKIKDSEILRVIIDKKMVLDALTQSDGKTSGGILDTGVPCSIAAQMLASGKISKSGVLPPELALEAREFFSELRKRKIIVMKNGMQIN